MGLLSKEIKENILSSTFFITGKTCFLLVISGFCIPIAFDLNGFQLAPSDIATKGLSLALYGLIISAIIGLSYFLFLTLYHVFIEEWSEVFFNIANSKIANYIIIIICACCGLIPFFVNLKEYGKDYQTGILLIIIGYALIIIFNAISIIKENIWFKKYNTGYIDWSKDYERDPRDICP
jgi:hypothetical protein